MIAAADLRQVDDAVVLIDDEPVGRLTRTAGDDVEFHYAGEWVDEHRSGRRNSVAWTLPVDGTYPVTYSGGAVPPFFAGLLPEGVRLGAVVSATKTSPDDHLTLLLAVGGDAIGNVRVVPAGSEIIDPTAMFDPRDHRDFRRLFDRMATSSDADPFALPGVQPKVSAAMWSVPTSTASGPAILKLTPPSGFPRLVENEHFFLRMAAGCGLAVPRQELLHDDAGRSALLVRRFDRANGRRIPQEDACQVAGLYPASKYRMKSETAVEVLAEACVRGGGSRLAAVREFLRMIIFSWLIGNGDLHGKNLSIHAPDGVWMPTPAYDLVTTQPYTGWRDPMAMNLYSRANRLRRRDFIDAGGRWGLGEAVVTRLIDQLLDRAEPWVERIGEIGFGERDTERLVELIGKRIRGLRA
ncbi:type II toxin-antitoxin system HipA family toxin [Nakamurella sp. YIM 132087]|uniref:Type II toxin-antitoxin system HipA family toxin n=1 Tax=Nakamurella alba TaxID=2665158 RepID=A0A7K1FPG9_9ACTN|nr:type II toxin-antitoxin system HipA family toxin [Nakamurella alba]MTD15113.1 type II toxin-antitoxin system HipA family toxin [Nakamurella alba]